MNPLQRSLIEKAGHDHGFEYAVSIEDRAVTLASARHRAQVRIDISDDKFILVFSSPFVGLLSAELERSFPYFQRVESGFVASDQDALTRLLRRAAELAHALPNQAAHDYESTLQQELEQLPGELKDTEVERLVRQRVGQQAFRSAMLDYWGGACAVTGIAITEVLRASHAKPWSVCTKDSERLDVFNGFLLSANLDALFDRFLISFAEDGTLLISSSITQQARELLSLNGPLRLRWLAPEHSSYLKFHRRRFGT